MSTRAEQLIEVMQRVDNVAPGSGLPKHLKMTQSPFVFLRGASSLFYADIQCGLLILPEAAQQLPLTAVIGDCHISNFGFFSEEGSCGEQIIFAPNDFDDACIGHASWDLMRFMISLLLCADHCSGVKSGDYAAEEAITKRCVDQQQALAAARAFLHSYTDTCQQLASGKIDYNYVADHFPSEHILSKRYQKALDRSSTGAEYASKSSLAKAVDLHQTPLQFRSLTERFEPLSESEYNAVKQQFAPYVDDQILDIVTRLGAGTGSVNMQRYYLLVGPDHQAKKADWPLYHIVEVKQQRAAAPLYDFSTLSPVNQQGHAHLTVTCQRRMQRNPDLVLDEVEWRGAHWLVRSRHHAKVGIDPEHIATGKRAIKGGFVDYASECGKVLALAHGRYDRRSSHFEHKAASILPNLYDALIHSASAYAEQVKADWQWLKAQEKV